MSNIACVVPIYHSSDILFNFTKETIESIKSANHNIYLYIIVNYSTKELYPYPEKFNLDPCIKFTQILENPKGNEVGASWNYGIKQALKDGCDYVMVLNNDLVLNKLCVDNLVSFAEDHKEFIMWTASEWLKKETLHTTGNVYSFSEYPHFSYFMVNKKTIDTIGWFDENLKMAYFEDCLYHYQIIVLGQKAGKTESAKFYHYGSRSIKTDDNLYDKNKRSYEDNRAYVIKKCGFDPHEKVYVPPESMLEVGFKFPFNDKKKNWKGLVIC